MRVFFYIFFLHLCAFAQAQTTSLKWLVPKEVTKAGKWEKLEIGVKLPQAVQKQVDLFVSGKNAVEKINPFDPEQLSIEAVFEHCSASDTSKKDYTRKIFGFYYQDFNRDETAAGDAAWLKQNTEHAFRIRFAPGMTGLWKCTVQLKTAKGNTHLGKMYFNCVNSASKGPVVLQNNNNTRDRYLKYTEGNEMFFPVGMNLVWVHLDEMKVNDHKVYADWMQKLSANGANYTQLSMLPFTYGVEWESLGNYSSRMKNAWELDQLVDLAHEKNIYVNMLLLIHDEFITGNGWIHKNNHWTNNIYNSAKNNGATSITTPLEFFTDETCKTYFKKRLRYTLSRYGYSVNVPVLELLSEIDNAVPGYNDNGAEGTATRRAVKQWFVEMKTYIEKELGYEEKLVSASYAQGSQVEDIANRVFSAADVVLLHFYGRDLYTNYNQRAVHVSTMLENELTANKPVIFDETGANVFPTLDKCSDITFHNNLWSSSFMGCFGTGQSWWWDNAILPNGYEKSFRGISRFLQDENFSVMPYTNEKWIENGRFNARTDYEAYYLKATDGGKAVGWIHNTSFWWANLKNDNPCMADIIAKNNGSSIDVSDDSRYAKDYAKGKAKGLPEALKGDKFKIKMPLGNTEYIIKWYDTVTGEATGQTQTVKSSSSGKVKFDIPEMTYPQNRYGALGFKIVKFSR